MRSLRGGRGVSEIVGTLMLVLIVVVAATVLSAVIASYQKQLLAERQLAQNRGLESLVIVHAAPSLANGGGSWLRLNFTLASLYINPSTVTNIRLNDNPLKQYTTWRLNLSTGNFQAGTVGPGGQLVLGPRDEVAVVISLNASNSSFSFYNTSFALHTTDYVKIEVLTSYENDFTRVFIPPTAIAIVSTITSFSNGTFVTLPVLDGSNSFQPGNGTLVSWAWKVTPDNIVASGEKAVVKFNATFASHTITLTVTNSFGLISLVQLKYP